MTRSVLPWHEDTMVGLDFETTGVNTDEDRAVTATVAEVHADGTTGILLNWLINPGIEISEGAAEVHGISNEKARAEGQGPAEAIEEIVSTLDDLLSRGENGRPLVIYNAPFDDTLLDRECRRYGLKTLRERASENGYAVNVIDPLVLDKGVNKWVRGKGQRKLTPTAARYGVVLDNAHESEADVMAAVAVARAIGRKYSYIGRSSLTDLQNRQRSWHSEQAAGLANWFARQGAEADGEEAAEFEAKALSVRAEAGLWPLRPFQG